MNKQTNQWMENEEREKEDETEDWIPNVLYE
jgi:hypothetical protein